MQSLSHYVHEALLHLSREEVLIMGCDFDRGALVFKNGRSPMEMQ